MHRWQWLDKEVRELAYQVDYVRGTENERNWEWEGYNWGKCEKFTDKNDDTLVCNKIEKTDDGRALVTTREYVQPFSCSCPRTVLQVERNSQCGWVGWDLWLGRHWLPSSAKFLKTTFYSLFYIEDILFIFCHLLIVQWSGCVETLCHFNNIHMLYAWSFPVTSSSRLFSWKVLVLLFSLCRLSWNNWDVRRLSCCSCCIDICCRCGVLWRYRAESVVDNE